MYRENHLFDEIFEDKANVARHHRIFETWWDAALDEATSADLIAVRVKELADSDPSIPAAVPASAMPRGCVAESWRNPRVYRALDCHLAVFLSR